MQSKVKEFNQLKDKLDKMPVYARLLDIQSELGELSKEYLKVTNYGINKFEHKNEFLLEFGDCLYSLLSLACELNLNAETCLDIAISKYKARLDKNGKMESGQ